MLTRGPKVIVRDFAASDESDVPFRETAARISDVNKFLAMMLAMHSARVYIARIATCSNRRV